MLYFCGDDDDEERCCLFPKLECFSKKLFKEISLTPLQTNTILATFGSSQFKQSVHLIFIQFLSLHVLAFNKNRFHLFSSGLSQASNNELYTVYLCRTRWLKLEAYGRDKSLHQTL